MKSIKSILLGILTVFGIDVSAQNNVGIGTSSPSNKLEVHGNLLVTAPSLSTTTAPTVGQTKTMVNNATITFLASDTTGRFYDTGGPAGDYNANISNAICVIASSSNSVHTGIEIHIESIDLDLGDSLIVKTSVNGEVLMAVGNGYSLTGAYIFNSQALHIRFKSDNNVNTVGNGFSILFKRIYAQTNQPVIADYSGKSLFFETSTGALRSGLISNQPRGFNSTALGTNLTASGSYSTAFGSASVAGGLYSMAVGDNTEASGISSIAMGSNTLATGSRSTAFGYYTEANGSYATAMGFYAQANSFVSTSLGFYAHANGSYSTSLGSYTEANGENSTSIGYYSKANGFSGTSLGMFNDPIVSTQEAEDLSTTTPLFIIGNGDNNSNRSNAMVVRKDGHVGIGTNDPEVQLHIRGGVEGGYADGDGYVVIGGVDGPNLLFDNNEIWVRNDGAAANLRMQPGGGKVHIGAGTPFANSLFSVNGQAAKEDGGSWLAYSDSRLKHDIKPYQDGLSALLQIEPVSYKYNTQSSFDTTKAHIGVIAQDLREIAPYMVVGTDIPGADGTPSYLSVNNSAMTYMLINAVKELNQENEDLKGQVAAIKTLLDTLLQQNDGIDPVSITAK